MPVVTVGNAEEYQKFINADKTTVALFEADWAEQCAQVKDVLGDLSKIIGDKLQFINLNAENFPEISMKHQVSLLERTKKALTNNFPITDRSRANGHILH